MELFIHEEKQMIVSEKWVELRLIMLSEINTKTRKASAAHFLSLVE